MRLASIQIDSNEAQLSCERARPFIKWVGGKGQLVGQLIPRIPQLKPGATYHEPFVGGGAIFFALQPSRARLSDINPELINAYGIVRDDVERLIRDLRRHKYEQEYFYQVRNADRLPAFDKWSDVRRASRLIFLNKTCFNGLYRVNSAGHFNTPFGRYVNPTIVDAANLRACSDALRRAEVKISSFENVLTVAKAGDFVYFDPPYVPVSDTAYFTSYSKDGFGPDMQRRLFEVCCGLHRRKVKFMLSNSDVPFIRDLYSKFDVDTVFASRSVNSRADRRGKIAEVVVTNY